MALNMSAPFHNCDTTGYNHDVEEGTSRVPRDPAWPLQVPDPATKKWTKIGANKDWKRSVDELNLHPSIVAFVRTLVDIVLLWYSSIQITHFRNVQNCLYDVFDLV